jgi:hypothetical protein
MNLQYTYIVIFIFLAYLIFTDSSIAKFFVYTTDLLKFQYEKYKWIVMYHPRTPWARYSMHRRSMKLAEELMKELEKKK